MYVSILNTSHFKLFDMLYNMYKILRIRILYINIGVKHVWNYILIYCKSHTDIIRFIIQFI